MVNSISCSSTWLVYLRARSIILLSLLWIFEVITSSDIEVKTEVIGVKVKVKVKVKAVSEWNSDLENNKNEEQEQVVFEETDIGEPSSVNSEKFSFLIFFHSMDSSDNSDKA